MVKNSEPKASLEAEKGTSGHSSAHWLKRKAIPNTMVAATHRRKCFLSLRAIARTAICMVPLEQTSRPVNVIARHHHSSSSPSGGQLPTWRARSVKYTANRPEKNMHSDAKKTMVPTVSGDAR